jgi:hypothetical protein
VEVEVEVAAEGRLAAAPPVVVRLAEVPQAAAAVLAGKCLSPRLYPSLTLAYRGATELRAM